MKISLRTRQRGGSLKYNIDSCGRLPCGLTILRAENVHGNRQPLRRYEKQHNQHEQREQHEQHEQQQQHKQCCVLFTESSSCGCCCWCDVVRGCSADEHNRCSSHIGWPQMRRNCRVVDVVVVIINIVDDDDASATTSVARRASYAARDSCSHAESVWPEFIHPTHQK